MPVRGSARACNDARRQTGAAVPKVDTPRRNLRALTRGCADRAHCAAHSCVARRRPSADRDSRAADRCGADRCPCASRATSRTIAPLQRVRAADESSGARVRALRAGPGRSYVPSGHPANATRSRGGIAPPRAHSPAAIRPWAWGSRHSSLSYLDGLYRPLTDRNLRRARTHANRSAV